MGQCSGYLLSNFLWSIMINRRYVISSLFQGTKKFKTFFYDKVRWISHADFFFGVSQPYFYLTFANIIYLHQKFLPAQRLLANFQNKTKTEARSILRVKNSGQFGLGSFGRTVDPWSLFTMKIGLIICLHRASVVRVFHQMSNETGDSDSKRFGVDDGYFFDDPLVGFKVKVQFSVVFFNDDPGSHLDTLCSNTTHI